MGEKTAIAWTDHTFNPWIGCREVGPVCDNCYARELDKRHKWGGGTHWGDQPRYRTSESNWGEPLKWNRRAGAMGRRPRVFCASLADVYDNEAPAQWRDDLRRLIERTPNLDWLLVTKRIGNVSRYTWPAWIIDGFPSNVRLLITVCNQEEADRDIPKLLALPCKNGISYEPALGPVDWSPWLSPKGHINWGENKHPTEKDQRSILAIAKAAYYKLGGKLLEWIIVGGESKQGAGKARPFDLAWARSSVRQCKAADVPVFVKQIGSATLGWCLGNRPTGEYPELEDIECQAYESSEGPQCPPGYCACRENRAGADPAEWPEDLRVREFPI